jgi:hypothetical protein
VKDAEGAPPKFEPEKVTDAHGQSNEGNKAEKIESDFGKNDLPLCADTKQESLEKVKKIYQEAIEPEKEKVPAELA